MSSLDKELRTLGVTVESENSEALAINYRRVLYQMIRYWYVVLAVLLVAFIVAFLVNRYSPRVYPVTASLIVKEAGEVSGAELLYNNPLVNFRRNYLNELYILKSYPLIQGVVEDLNFDVALLRKGNILTSEIFDDRFPVQVFPNRTESGNGCTLEMTILSATSFRLESVEGETAVDAQEFRFGDSIRYHSFSGVVSVRQAMGLNEIIGQSFLLTYTPSLVVTDQYIRRLTAEWAEEGAGIVRLSIEGTNPRKEEKFLDGLISHYQRRDLENKNETASRTVAFIGSQLESIRDSLRFVEWQLEKFKGANVVTDLNGEALRLYEKIEQYESERARLSMSENYFQYLIDYINDGENLHQIILPTSVGIDDPILSNLISQMSQLQTDIKFGKAENPLVTGAARRIEQIKKDIIESVRNLKRTNRMRIDFLSKEVRLLEAELSHLPVAQRNLVSIQRNYTLLENLYIFLLQKHSEAAITRASNTSDVVLVNPPKAGLAISPSPLRNYLLALGVGIFLPLAFFLVREVTEGKVQSREDIEKLTTIPFLGGIGHKKGRSNLAVFDSPKSSLAESFRALRSNLHYFVNQEKAVFMITSSISGEGKTFTSINLASVLSLSGKKTLIIGADLRIPKIHPDLNLSNNVGLSNYLAGLASYDDIVQETAYPNLDFISAGPVPPNPSELLLGARMDEFMEKARVNYDYVVIDTPPLAVVTDAFVLSRFADHTLFVVRQNYTPKTLLKAVEESHKMGKLARMSVVFNDIYKSGPGYGYGYAYGYTYGYHSTASGPGGYYTD